MSELAYNLNGDRFTPPASAKYWRPKRMQPKGPPATVYKDGIPARAPIDADIELLRNAVDGVPGRYRLDPVDDEGRLVEGPAAYVQIDEPDSEATQPAPPVRDARDEVLVQLLRVQNEAMRTQAEMFARVVDANVEMAKAASELIRAADGAGLPARQPVPLPEPVYVDTSTDDDDRDVLPPATDWIGLINTVGQILPMLCDAAGIGGLLDGLRGRGGGGRSRTMSTRSAETPRASSPRPAPTAPAPRPVARTSAPGAALSTSAEPSRNSGAAAVAPASVELEQPADSHDAGTSGDEITQEVADSLPPQAKNLLLHLKSIQEQLTADEWKLCEVVIQEMPQSERLQWRDQLLALSVDDAVALIRSAIAASAKGGEA